MLVQTAWPTAIGVYGLPDDALPRLYADRVSSLGFRATFWTAESDITSNALAGVDVLYVIAGSAASLNGKSSLLGNWIAQGHGLVVEQPNQEGRVGILPPNLSISIFSRGYDGSNTGPDPVRNVSITELGRNHPITRGLNTADISQNADRVRSQDVAPAYDILGVQVTNPAYVALAAASYGSGRIVFHTGFLGPNSFAPGSDRYLLQMLDWAAQREPQTLFLDFDSNFATYRNPFDALPGTISLTYLKPSFDGSHADRDAITDAVKDTFNGYQVIVTTERPLSGSFSTISIGGSHANVPAYTELGLNENTLGVADGIDFDNLNRKDTALVFSENFDPTVFGPSRNERIAQTIAHEAGHLFGLFHVRDEDQLLYPYADDAPTVIGRSSNTTIARSSPWRGTYLVNITNSQGNPITEDSAAGLEFNLNTSGDAGAAYSSDEIRRFVAFNTKNSLGIDLFDVRVGAAVDSDILPMFVDVGDITADAEVTFNIPVAYAGNLFFMASSADGGEFDLFSISSDVAIESFRKTLSDILVSPLGGEVDLGQLFGFEFATDVVVFENGAATLIGSLESRLVEPPRISSISVGEAIEIRWGSVPNQRYSVERTIDLTVPFTPVAEHIIATPPQNVYQDSNPGSSRSYFYRVRLEW